MRNLMSMVHGRFASLMLVSLFATGCVSGMSWETESAGSDFPDGLRVLGEVIMVASRQEVLAGDGLMKGWRQKLTAAGYRDSDIVDGSEVTVWAYCFGYNSGVPMCAHHGHYVAHVPPGVRENLRGDPDSEADSSGDLVEIELVRTAEGALVGKVIEVYRGSGDWSPCREVYLQRGAASSALLSLSGVGPPRASWIECEAGVEADGWIRRPVPGAPVNDGPPVSVWVKLPR